MCEHASFACLGHVIRLSVAEAGPLVAYVVEVTIHCTECQTPFHFLGLPGGLRNRTPSVSFDGLEARLPIAPGIAGRAEGEANADQID